MTNNLDAHIGSRIQITRKKAGLSQSQLAEFVGVSTRQVRRWEAGNSCVPSVHLYKIAKHLNMPVESYFVGSTLTHKEI